jgi:hypothetical protein
MSLREDTAQSQKDLALRVERLEQMCQMCRNLKEATTSLGKVLDYHSKVLSDRACDVLRAALAVLVAVELDARDKAARLKGGGQ